MEITVDINKRINWINQRTNLGNINEEYVRLQMQELVIEVVKKMNQANEQPKEDEPALGISVVSNNEAKCKFEKCCGIDHCNLDECSEYEPEGSEVAVCSICKTPRPPHYQGEGSCESCAQ